MKDSVKVSCLWSSEGCDQTFTSKAHTYFNHIDKCDSRLVLSERERTDRFAPVRDKSWQYYQSYKQVLARQREARARKGLGKEKRGKPGPKTKDQYPCPKCGHVFLTGGAKFSHLRACGGSGKTGRPKGKTLVPVVRAAKKTPQVTASPPSATGIIEVPTELLARLAKEKEDKDAAAREKFTGAQSISHVGGLFKKRVTAMEQA